MISEDRSQSYWSFCPALWDSFTGEARHSRADTKGNGNIPPTAGVLAPRESVSSLQMTAAPDPHPDGDPITDSLITLIQIPGQSKEHMFIV